MKRRNLFLVILICMIVLIGCGKNGEEKVQSSNKGGGETSMETEKALGEVQGETAEKESDGKRNNLFAEFKNLNFSFLSGAGGWSTEMMIAEDGTFRGVYQDGEMGSYSESYPKGTVYYCSFQGKFTEPVQKEEYVCSTTIESISYDNPPGIFHG